MLTAARESDALARFRADVEAPDIFDWSPVNSHWSLVKTRSPGLLPMTDDERPMTRQEEDPPGMTRRQAAIAAAELYERRTREGGG
jgi:hypothetical protein